MRQLALLLSAAFALASSPATTVAQTRGVSANSIKIGTVTDLSGPLASWGVSATNGIRMRFDEANAAGGIHGRRIEFIVEDMQYQIPNAIRASNKLMTSDQVFAFIATLGTPPNNAIMKSVMDAGFPYLFPLSAGLQMSEPPHPLKVPFLLNDRDTMRGAVRYITEQRGVKRICYQVMANDYGAEVENGITSAAEKLGLTVTASGKHRPTETEFTAAVLQLRNSGCQALFIGAVARDPWGHSSRQWPKTPPWKASTRPHPSTWSTSGASGPPSPRSPTGQSATRRDSTSSLRRRRSSATPWPT